MRGQPGVCGRANPAPGFGGPERRPQALKQRYLEEAKGASPAVPAPPPDREIKSSAGWSNYEYFVQSLREGLPSKETAEEGHYAAGAAHLGNLALRRGRRMIWDPATNEVSEG